MHNKVHHHSLKMVFPLSCPHCRQSYSISEHRSPMKIIPCSHNLCSQCVPKIDNCPSCSKRINSAAVDVHIKQMLLQDPYQLHVPSGPILSPPYPGFSSPPPCPYPGYGAAPPPCSSQGFGAGPYHGIYGPPIPGAYGGAPPPSPGNYSGYTDRPHPGPYPGPYRMTVETKVVSIPQPATGSFPPGSHSHSHSVGSFPSSMILPAPFSYFISLKGKRNVVLACSDDRRIQHTPNRVKFGWEGWTLEEASHGVFFIVSKKTPQHVLACNDHGQLTVTPNKVAHGWEGWRIIESAPRSQSYRIISNKHPHHVLGFDGANVAIRPTHSHDLWELELAPISVFVYSNKIKRHVLAIKPDDGKVVTTPNKVHNGWEGLRILRGPNGLEIKAINYSARFLSINHAGAVVTSPASGSLESFLIEPSGVANVFFIISQAHPSFVLACNDHGGITTTPNKVVHGWEGWVIEEFE